MNMNLIGVGQGNRTEEIGAVNKLEVRSVNRESTEKILFGYGHWASNCAKNGTGRTAQ